MSTCGDGSNIATAKRKRGRAPGSKNKPKNPAATSNGSPGYANLQTHVLNIPAGGDVAETVAAFARGCRNFGVCVLSAFGAVAAAVLWEASPYSSALTFQGSFDLISMTATFLPGGSEGTLAVTLAGAQGQVVGGVVAGPVVAAGTVIVVAATFASPAFHCFDLMNNTSSSMLPVIGGVEGWGNSFPAGYCEEVKKTGPVDGSSVFVDGGEATNWEEGSLDEYLQQVEQHFELQPVAGGDFSGVSVAGGHSGGEETERNTLEDYIKELEQCLVLPTADGGASSVSSGGGAGDEEMNELNSASVPGGLDVGDMFVEHYDFPTMVDGGAFGSGRDGCGELFAFDSFGVSGVCPLLY